MSYLVSALELHLSCMISETRIFVFNLYFLLEAIIEARPECF